MVSFPLYLTLITVLSQTIEAIKCPPLNIDTSNGGRCGPLYGGVRCNKALQSYAVYCNAANGWCGTTDAHRDAQKNEDKYDYQPESCTVEVCPPLNTDDQNGGRCGPLYGGVRCNKALQSYAVYCNADNGWCGVTDAHRDAQPNEDKYDYRPISCYPQIPQDTDIISTTYLPKASAVSTPDKNTDITYTTSTTVESISTIEAIKCPPLNIDSSNGGRCGPLYGGVRCNKNLRNYAVYCNSANGWCGTTNAHRDAQRNEDKYDYQPESCTVEVCPPLNTDDTNDGRCGPLYGGVRCNKQLQSYAVYCNAANGWCGVTDAHRDAQPNEDKYDYRPISCYHKEFVPNTSVPSVKNDTIHHWYCCYSTSGVICSVLLIVLLCMKRGRNKAVLSAKGDPLPQQDLLENETIVVGETNATVEGHRVDFALLTTEGVDFDYDEEGAKIAAIR